MTSKSHKNHDEHHHLTGRRLVLALGVNLLLTIVEVIGGIVSGSLALLSDALHNFSDCGSLLVALIARRVARRPADRRRTFGYGRAEIVGALVNLTALAIISVYLIGEAIWRLWEPRTVDGMMIIVIAVIALLIDLLTAFFLYASSKESINIRAAFIHSLGDALASVGVIVAGICVLLWNFYLSDIIVSVLIAGYILLQALPALSQTVSILMESVPSEIKIDDLTEQLQKVEHVLDVHHVHVWHLDEKRLALEAHVTVHPENLAMLQEMKSRIKAILQTRFGIAHSTLEFELPGECSPSAPCIPDHREDSEAG